jgi:hypothetical protein
MTRLFEKLARPIANKETPSAFLKGLRWMAIDGTVFDLPDTEENERVFGYPGSPKGTKAAFPKARLVILVELGTHIITDALISPYRIGERVRAIKLLRSVEQGMLVTWDRGLHSFKLPSINNVIYWGEFLKTSNSPEYKSCLMVLIYLGFIQTVNRRKKEQVEFRSELLST